MRALPPVLATLSLVAVAFGPGQTGAPSSHAFAAAAMRDGPAPFFWDAQDHRRAGGEADRFERDDLGPMRGESTWYHLSVIGGGDRLRVVDHNPSTSTPADSAIASSEDVAWHVATTLTGGGGGLARRGEMPSWARARTGGADGSSAGLIFALADLDLLTAGRLAGGLIVAGTGTIGSDGVVTAVRMVDVKVAAARLARADVVFVPDLSSSTATGSVTTVPSHLGAPARRTIGAWLDTAGYEQAGREAAAHPAASAIVLVDDIRQALAWLCGRTALVTTCVLASTAAAIPMAAARPYDAPAGATGPPASGARAIVMR